MAITEDICVARFAGQGCADLRCSSAHDIWELSNLDHWVAFAAPEVAMLDFLAYKYQVHHYFRVHFLPGVGPVVRFATAEMAAQVVEEYGDCYNATPLARFALLAGRIPESGSFASEAETLGSWADEVERHGSQGSEGLSEEETSPTAILSPVLSPLHSHRQSLSPPPTVGKKQRFVLHASHAPPGESCTDAVLRIMRTNPESLAKGCLGWEALHQVWRLSPSDFDGAVLALLQSKPVVQQQHLLLSMAAIDLSFVKNLSAYLSSLIKEHDRSDKVCLYFLAGLCNDQQCRCMHPTGTLGWTLLQQKWNITYQDLDYTVLNFLSKKALAEQENILQTLSDMDLSSIKNLPAYLSSLIQKFDGPSTARPRPRPGGERPSVNGRYYLAAPTLLAPAPVRPAKPRGRPGMPPMWLLQQLAQAAQGPR